MRYRGTRVARAMSFAPHVDEMTAAHGASREGLWLALVFASAHFLHSDRVPNPALEGLFAPAIA